VSWFEDFKRGWHGSGDARPEPEPERRWSENPRPPFEDNSRQSGTHDHDRLWETALRERDALRARIADLETRLREPADPAPHAAAIAALEAELAECKSIIAGMLAEQTSFSDQLADCRRKGKRAVAERDALEKLLRFPGVRNALVKALHPDVHPDAGEQERRDRDEMFKTMMAVFERFEH
jgi:hypothetical protein